MFAQSRNLSDYLKPFNDTESLWLSANNLQKKKCCMVLLCFQCELVQEPMVPEIPSHLTKQMDPLNSLSKDKNSKWKGTHAINFQWSRLTLKHWFCVTAWCKCFCMAWWWTDFWAWAAARNMWTCNGALLWGFSKHLKTKECFLFMKF